MWHCVFLDCSQEFKVGWSQASIRPWSSVHGSGSCWDGTDLPRTFDFPVGRYRHKLHGWSTHGCPGNTDVSTPLCCHETVICNAHSPVVLPASNVDLEGAVKKLTVKYSDILPTSSSIIQHQRVDFSELSWPKLPAAPALSQTDSRLMKNWMLDNCKPVRQRTVGQDSTMDKSGTLPLSAYESSRLPDVNEPMPSLLARGRQKWLPQQMQVMIRMTHGTHATQMMCLTRKRHPMMIWDFNSQ